MLRWFAVHTKASKEDQVERGIVDQGWRAASPLCSYERKRSRRIETVERPLFRRYVFAEFDLALPGWQSIAYTKGVVCILGSTGRPQAIPRGVVETIIAAAAGGAIPLLKDEIIPFKRGEKVRIKDGVWTGFDVLVHLDEGARVQVLLDLFGARRVIPVQRESIARG